MVIISPLVVVVVVVVLTVVSLLLLLLLDDDDDDDDDRALLILPARLQEGVKHSTSTLLASTRSQLMEMTAKPGPISLRVARLV